MHLHVCSGTCNAQCPYNIQRQAHNIFRETETLFVNRIISQLAGHQHNNILSRDQSQLQASLLSDVREFFRQLNIGYPVPGSSQLTSHGQYFDRRGYQNSAFGQNVGHPFSAHYLPSQQTVGQIFQGPDSDRDRFYGQSTTDNERPVSEQTFQQRPEFYQTHQFPFNRETSQQYSFEQRLQQPTNEQTSESLSYRQYNERVNQSPVNGQIRVQPNFEQRYHYRDSGHIYAQDMTQRLSMPNYGQTYPQSEFGVRHPHANFEQQDLGQHPQQYLRHHLIQPDIAQSQHFEHRHSQQFMAERLQHPELGLRNAQRNFWPEYPQQHFEQSLQQRDLEIRPPFPLSDFESRRSFSNFDSTLAHPNYGPRLAQPELNVRPTPGQLYIMRLLTEPIQDQRPLTDTSLSHGNLGQFMTQSNFGQHATQPDFDQLLSRQRYFSERPVNEQLPENISYRQASLNTGLLPDPLPTQSPFNRQTLQEIVFQGPENAQGPHPIHSQNFEQLNNEERQQPTYVPGAGSFGEHVPQKSGYQPIQQPIYPSRSYAYNKHTLARNEDLVRADCSQLFGSGSPKELHDTENAQIAQPISESLRPSNIQIHEDSKKTQSTGSIDQDSQRPQLSLSDRISYKNKDESQSIRPVVDQSPKPQVEADYPRPNELVPGPLDLFGLIYPEENVSGPLRPVILATQCSERTDSSNIYQTSNTILESDLIPIDPDSIDHRPVGCHSPVFSEEARNTVLRNRPLSSVSIDTHSNSGMFDEPSSPRYFQALHLLPVSGQSPEEQDMAKSYEHVESSKTKHTPSPGSLDLNSSIYPDEDQASGLIGPLSQESIADFDQHYFGPEIPNVSSSRILNTMPFCGQNQIEQENLNHNPLRIFGSHSPVFSEEAQTSRLISSLNRDREEELSSDNLGWNEQKLLGFIRQPSPVPIVDQSAERSVQSLSPKIYHTMDLVQFVCQSPKEPDKTISPQTSRAQSPEAGGPSPQEAEVQIQQRPVFAATQQVVDEHEQLGNEQIDSERDETKCNLI